jgi:cell division protein FtsB
MKLSRRTVYIIVGSIVLLILFGNAGFRTLVARYWEKHQLTIQVEQLKSENALLRKEAKLLEDNPTYMQRIARKELGVVSKGEVEYRFKK